MTVLAQIAASRPLVLRTLPRAAAQMQNALSRLHDPLPLTAGGAQLFAAIEGPRGEGAEAHWLHLTLDGAPAALRLSESQAQAAAGTPVEGLPAAEAALLIEEGLAAFLDEAEAALGLTLRAEGWQSGRVELPVTATLNLQGRGANRQFLQQRLPLRLSVAAARSLAEALTARRLRRDDPRGLRLALRAETQPLSIRPAALAAIACGDGIALDGCGWRLALEGQLFAPAEPLDGGRWRLTGPFRPPLAFEKGHSVPEDTPPAPVSTPGPVAAPDAAGTAKPGEAKPGEAKPVQAADLDELDLRLTFAAGSTTLTLGELRALGPGAILETAEDAGSQVDILANGRMIGTGELVEVAGRRAVQVRTLFTGR